MIKTSLIIKEFIGDKENKFFSESKTYSTHIPKVEINNSFTAAEDSLMVEIEGTHGYPYSTGNFTRYMPEALRNTSTWTYPYNRPLILHHNTKDGKVIGRIVNVECIEHSKRSNSPALKFLVNVSDEDAKKAVKDGRLDTVSIGITAGDVRCSICGKQITDNEQEFCGHERGQIYEHNGQKEICYWDIHEFTAKEISYVVVPSDIYAKTERFYTVKNNTNINESLDETQGVKNNLNTPETNSADTKKISELELKIKNLEEENSNLKNQVEEIQKEKTALETAAVENKLLNEGLEDELSETKLKLKESLIQQLQTIRLAIGKEELDSEKISNRSEESIRDSILDIREDFNTIITQSKNIDEKETLPQPESVKNPSVIDDNSEKSSKLNVNESEDSNIDLKAGLENIFSTMVSLRTKI